MALDLHDISVSVNGKTYQRTVESRLLLSDFIRHDLRLPGTHVGCEHGVCGACTILFDGAPVRSCLMFAVQADGHEIPTVEGWRRRTACIRSSRRFTNATACSAAIARPAS